MDAYTIAKQIVQTLYQEGFVAYFAGGWVRDFLMDHPSDDIDIATSATVDDIQRLFRKTLPLGVSFGIVVIVEGGHHFEVATFRKDREYHDGRRPTGIDFATPEEDAKRRDFTINGMFYDPIHSQILDYVDGQKDIERKIVRAIGSPRERFFEDRLRMIRAVRYASRFHFAIEAETITAIIETAPTLFPAVAIERVWNELLKIAAFSHLDRALISLQRLNLLPVIFPTLRTVSIDELKRRTARLPHFPKDTPVIAKILELFPGALLEEKEALCSYFKRSNSERAFVRFYHNALNLLLARDQDVDLHTWAHLYADPSFSLCFHIAALHFPPKEQEAFFVEHREKMHRLSPAVRKLQAGIPFITSSHLRAAGIPNGKHMGRLLKEGEKIAINESLDDPSAILSHLKTLPSWPTF